MKQQIPASLAVVIILVLVIIVVAVAYFVVYKRGPAKSAEEAKQSLEQTMQKSMAGEGPMEPAPTDAAAAPTGETPVPEAMTPSPGQQQPAAPTGEATQPAEKAGG